MSLQRKAEKKQEGGLRSINIVNGGAEKCQAYYHYIHIKYVERIRKWDRVLNARGSRCGQLVGAHGRSYLL